MANAELIKYNGGTDVLAWKYPSEELGTWTQLIVNEFQSAILFKDGEALDVFESGTHTLETANIPLLNKIINLPLGGRSSFTAEVWYVNKACFVDVKWGTPTPIQVQDPKYGVFVPVCTSGVFRIQIIDPHKFMIKLVGTLPAFDKNSVADYFKRIQMTMLKDSISSFLVRNQISVLELSENIRAVSSYMQKSIVQAIQEYGFKLDSFLIREINVLKDDPAVIKMQEAPAACAKCNTIIAKGAKFCPECGESLVNRCSGCNAVIEGQPKFCHECGVSVC